MASAVVKVLNNQRPYDCICDENLETNRIESTLQKWQEFLSNLAKVGKRASTDKEHLLRHLQMMSCAINH